MTITERSKIVEELLYAAGVLSRLGGLTATDGNLSARLREERILISGAGLEKRSLTPDSFVEFELKDESPKGASTEWQLHRELYRVRPDVQCVLHAHPPLLTAFAVAHKVPDSNLLAEARMTLGEIVLVPYSAPGTSALAKSLSCSSHSACVYLLANHGAVAVGATVREALHRFERAEFLAGIDLRTRQLGGGRPIAQCDS